MTVVKVELPPEVLDELDLEYEGIRDLDGAVSIAVQGVSVTAALVTLATLRPCVRRLAEALRRWRLRRPGTPIRLIVSGPGVDLRVDLPPNVSVADILEQLKPLVGEETTAKRSR